MIHLPIVERELRLAARRAMTYWSRTGLGAMAIVLTLWSVGLRFIGISGPAAGRESFRALSVVALFSAVITAMRLTSPSIAVEKRDGTLGLLFLTDLKPRDVVLGKLAVTSVGTFYRFLAIVPVLGIPVLLGGVTAGDLARLTVLMLNLMFLAAAVGLFASTLSTDEKGAAGLCTLLMLFVIGLGPLAALLAFWFGLSDWVTQFLFTLSPGYACISMLNDSGTGMAFWRSWLMGHVAAWLLLAGTCRLLPRVWQDRPATAKQEGRREKLRNLSEGDAQARGARRTKLLDVSPILWLTSRQRAVRWYPWIFLGAVGLLALWITLKYNAVWTEPGLAMGTTWLLQVFFKIWISTQSSTTFAADRDQGALELLFSTPLTTSDLIRGHWLGLRRLFAVPLVSVTVICLFWTSWTIIRSMDDFTSHIRILKLLCVCGANLVVLCADVWALGWLGLWMGVKSKSAHQASSRTQTRVLVFPWLAAMLSMSLSDRVFDFGEPAVWWLIYWLGWSLFFDVKYARMASRELRNSMRSAALDRFAAQPGEGARWMRGIRRLMTDRN